MQKDFTLITSAIEVSNGSIKRGRGSVGGSNGSIERGRGGVEGVMGPYKEEGGVLEGVRSERESGVWGVHFIVQSAWVFPFRGEASISFFTSPQ